MCAVELVTQLQPANVCDIRIRFGSRLSFTRAASVADVENGLALQAVSLYSFVFPVTIGLYMSTSSLNGFVHKNGSPGTRACRPGGALFYRNLKEASRLAFPGDRLRITSTRLLGEVSLRSVVFPPRPRQR